MEILYDDFYIGKPKEYRLTALPLLDRRIVEVLFLLSIVSAIIVLIFYGFGSLIITVPLLGLFLIQIAFIEDEKKVRIYLYNDQFKLIDNSENAFFYKKLKLIDRKDCFVIEAIPFSLEKNFFIFPMKEKFKFSKKDVDYSSLSAILKEKKYKAN